VQLLILLSELFMNGGHEKDNCVHSVKNVYKRKLQEFSIITIRPCLICNINYFCVTDALHNNLTEENHLSKTVIAQVIKKFPPSE
jgi:hypothetical protein